MTDKTMDAALDAALSLCVQASTTCPQKGIMQTPAGLVGTRDIYLVAGQIYAARIAAQAQERMVTQFIEAGLLRPA